MESYYRHDGEQLGFYKKLYIKAHRLSKTKDVFVIFVLQETKNSNLFGSVLKTVSNAIFDMKKVES